MMYMKLYAALFVLGTLGVHTSVSQCETWIRSRGLSPCEAYRSNLTDGDVVRAIDMGVVLGDNDLWLYRKH